MNLIDRIDNCETEEELDDLRDEIVQVGKVFGFERFQPLQQAYIKKQKELRDGQG